MSGDNAQKPSSIVAESANASHSGSGPGRNAQFASADGGQTFRDDDAAPLPASALVENWPSDPTIIGATGGSGTRVIARILQAGGLFLGSNRNRAEDSMPLAAFCDLWATVYVVRDGLFDDHGTRCLETAMARSFAAALEDHFGQQEPTARPWGWKVPSTIYLLPFFHTMFPRLRFVHLVRDGRDIAFSDNQNQLIKFGLPFLGWQEREERRRLNRRAQLPAGSLKLWSQANLAAADYGERKLGDRYLRVRFEDLCADPIVVAGRLLDFAGLEGNAQEIASQEVEPPTSVGRWRSQDAKVLQDLRGIGQAAGERFGYQPE
jgi:hypothetical protein